MRVSDDRGAPAPSDRVRVVAPAPGGDGLRDRLAGGFTVIGTRVSPRGLVSSWVVRPDGRRVTVAQARGLDTPDNIAATAAQAWRPDWRSGGAR